MFRSTDDGFCPFLLRGAEILLFVVLVGVSFISSDACDASMSLDGVGLQLSLVDPGAHPDLSHIGELDQAGGPLISADDIVSYDWENHELELSRAAWHRIHEHVTIEKLGPRWGIPFVVSIDSETIYAGSFWTLRYSERPHGPVVLLENLEKCRFIIHSEEEFAGITNDHRIRDWLAAAGKLSSGSASNDTDSVGGSEDRVPCDQSDDDDPDGKGLQ